MQRAVGLLHHDDVDAARQGGGIEASVQLFDLDEHLPGQLAHVVHGLTGLRDGAEQTQENPQCQKPSAASTGRRRSCHGHEVKADLMFI